MKKWSLTLIVITFLFLLLFAATAACSQPPATTEITPALKPAEFEVGPITFEPPVVMAGDVTRVTATVKNVGDIASTYEAVLAIDGQRTDGKAITLLPQQSFIAEFEVAELTAGKHTISIGQSQISIDVLTKPTKIAFASYYGDYYNWEICTMDSDGTDIARITKDAALDLHPTWSPDGTKIAFESTRESHNLSSIYVMDSDGKNVKCLTPEPRICRFPVWSPDGKKIAYCVMRRGGTGTWRGGVMTVGAAEILPDAIFIMGPDGGGKTQVAGGWCPSWFPDSQRIAFMSNYSGIWEIYSSNIHGSEIKKYVSFPKARANYGSSLPSSEFPMLAVSPDGNSIVLEYFDNTPGGGQDIYVLKLDTGKVTNLTNKLDGYKYCPTWSPDSKKIAFTLETTNDLDIYVINADGSNMIELIENGLWPSWQR